MKVFLGVLAALAPVLAAVVIGLFNRLQQQKERLTAVEGQVSEKRRAAYLAMLDPIFTAMRAVVAGEPQPDQRKLAMEMFDAQKELVLFGSDEVMKAYQAWQMRARGRDDGFGGTRRVDRRGSKGVGPSRDEHHA